MEAVNSKGEEMLLNSASSEETSKKGTLVQSNRAEVGKNAPMRLPIAAWKQMVKIASAGIPFKKAKTTPDETDTVMKPKMESEHET